MTDRELLEMAAKAAGIQGCLIEDADEFNFWLTKPDSIVGQTWAPLTDDGDALRLAVALKMNISLTECGATVDCCDVTRADIGDPYVAIRRAIVRAAAEVGAKK